MAKTQTVQHTPEPYTLDTRRPHQPYELHFIVDAQEEVVATVYRLPDAYLFKAAPDLLSELESTVKTLVAALDNMPYLMPAGGLAHLLTPEARAWRAKLQAKVKEARTVIAVAKGEGVDVED